MSILIVGQGIAGSCLAFCLQQEGIEIHILDATDRQGASRVAAGLINPLTGRNFVFSWKFNELFSAAEQIYQQLEEELGEQFFFPLPIIRELSGTKTINEWSMRLADQNLSDWTSTSADLGAYYEKIHPAKNYAQVKGARVYLSRLLNSLQQKWNSAGIFTPQMLDHHQVQWVSNKAIHQGKEYDAIVFCEGAGVLKNPYWNHLPITGNKGEVLLVRIPDLKARRVLKQGVFLIPLEEDIYWVGATYNWQPQHDHPTPEKRQYLLEKLEALMRVPFEVLDHRAALRPTTRDRRPIIGPHHTLNNCYIFNGLGTKGASLAPFFARQLARHLVFGDKIDPAVVPSRFK